MRPWRAISRLLKLWALPYGDTLRQRPRIRASASGVDICIGTLASSSPRLARFRPDPERRRGFYPCLEGGSSACASRGSSTHIRILVAVYRVVSPRDGPGSGFNRANKMTSPGVTWATSREVHDGRQRGDRRRYEGHRGGWCACWHVDRVEGDRIKLTKADGGEGRHKGHHHYISSILIADIEGNSVRLSANANVAVTMEQER